MRRARAILGLVLLTGVGCGLSDYEARMVEGQRRMQTFDEENRVLDKPINPPAKLVNKNWTPILSIFLRPPRGIQEGFQPQPRSDLLYEYLLRPQPGASTNVFTRVELALDPGTKKDFTKELLSCYQPIDKPKMRSRAIQGRELTFQTHEFDDMSGGHVSVNVLTNAPRIVAVSYWMLKGQEANAERIIDLSLGTLGIDGDSVPQRIAYQQNNPWAGLRK